MRKLNDWLVISCFCVFNTFLPTAAAQLPDSVRLELERAGLPSESAGVVVQPVDGGAALVHHQGGTGFNPASAMKLVTTLAALELLGPAYVWTTQVLETGTRRGDVLYGDLIIRGSGAPDLTLERFWLLLRSLRARGIRDIRGNLVIDRTRFAVRNFDAAAFDDDPSRPYNAGPDAFLLNYRTLRLRLSPDGAGKRLVTAVEPALHGIAVQGPTLGNGPCLNWRQQLRIEMHADTLKIGGIYPKACGEQEWSVHAHALDANRYAGALFRQLWQELGGSFSGQTLDGPVPPDARLVAESESGPLTQAVRDINKFSNNVMARQLLLTMASEIGAAPATAELGAGMVRAWMHAKDIPTHTLVVENGAGLSRAERISAEALSRLLVAAFNSPVMPEFVASLPLLGQDGTMRRRLKHAGVAGRAHIKSGSLKDVRAIAGYILAASGRRHAVVFLLNHPDAGRGTNAQDALLQWVYENG